MPYRRITKLTVEFHELFDDLDELEDVSTEDELKDKLAADISTAINNNTDGFAVTFANAYFDVQYISTDTQEED